MLHKMASSISNVVKQGNPNISNEKSIEITYGLEIILYEIILFGSVLLSALIFGLFVHSLVAIIAYSIIRGFASGAHAKTRIQCFLAYMIAIYSSILIPVYLFSSYILNVALLLFSLDMVMLLKCAPGDTAENPMTDEKKIQRKKFLSCISAVLLFTVGYFIKDINSVYANTLMISATWGCFMTTPIMYKIMGCVRTVPILN